MSIFNYLFAKPVSRAAYGLGGSSLRHGGRPSSGLQVGLRWPGRLQRRPAHARWPCGCRALVYVLFCSCSRRADRRCRVCMCVCAAHGAGSAPEGTDAASCGRAVRSCGICCVCLNMYESDFISSLRLRARMPSVSVRSVWAKTGSLGTGALSVASTALHAQMGRTGTRQGTRI